MLDLPGIYSIYPKSQDEEVVFQALTQMDHPDHPDLVLVVMDSTNLERNLFFATQILDLGIPSLLIANMMDLVDKDAFEINLEKLSELLGGVPLIPFNARFQRDLFHLKSAILRVSLEAASKLNAHESIDLRDWKLGINEEVALGEAWHKRIGQISSVGLTTSRINKHQKWDQILPIRYGLSYFYFFGSHFPEYFCLV